MKSVIKSLLILQVILISYISMSFAANPQLKWRKFGYSYGDFTAVAYNPVNHQLYAFGNIHGADYGDNYIMYTSPDSGKTWIPRNKYSTILLDDGISAYRINSKGQQFYSCRTFDDELFRSDDDGISFKSVFKTNNGIEDFRFDKQENIFLLTNFDSCIYISKNNGDKWDTLKINFEPYKFTIGNKDSIYVISSAKYFTHEDSIRNSYLDSVMNILYSYDTATKQFKMILKSSDGNNKKEKFLCLTSDDNFIYALSAELHYYFDYEGWYEEYWYFNPKIYKINKSNYTYKVISIPFSNDNKSYEGAWDIGLNLENKILLIWNSRVYQSDSAYSNWNNVVNDYQLDINNLNIVSNTDIVITESDWEYIYLSTNGGDNFKECKPDIKKIYPFSTVFEDKDSVLIVADTNNRIYQTYNDGLVWQDLTYDFNRTQKIICFTRSNQNNWVVGTERNGIYYLDDKKWISKNEHLKENGITQFCDSNNEKNFVIADSLVYQCEDEFQNELLLFDTPTKQIMDSDRGLFIVTHSGELYLYHYNTKKIEKLDYEWTKKKVTSIAMNKSNTIIAGTWKAGVFRSTDLGLTWEPANFELYSPYIYQVAPLNEKEFFALTMTGIFYTNNNGDIWSRNLYPEEDVKTDVIGKHELQALNDGKVFILYSNKTFKNQRECDYIEYIENIPIEPKSGWIDTLGYKINLCNVTFESNAQNCEVNGFSADNKFIYAKGEHFFCKYDALNGNLIRENYLPYDFNFSSDINDSCNIIVFSKLIRDLEEYSDIDEIKCYNLVQDSIFQTIKIQHDSNISQFYAQVKFDNSGENLIIGTYYIDTTVQIGEQCSGGELLFCDLEGNIQKQINTGAIIELATSPDRSILFFSDYKAYIDSTKYGIRIKEKERGGKVLNLITNEIFSLKNFNREFSTFEFSIENKYLKCSNRKGDLTSIYDLSNINSDSSISGEQLGGIIEPTCFINDNQFLYYKSNSLLLYDIAKKTVVKKSKNKLIDLFNQQFKVSHDYKKFLDFSWRISIVDLDSYLDSILVDVPERITNYNNIIDITPNPASYEAKIIYELKDAANVSISIFDCLGNKTFELSKNQYQFPGIHSLYLDTNDLSNGIYFCTIYAGVFTKTMKLIIMK